MFAHLLKPASLALLLGCCAASTQSSAFAADEAFDGLLDELERSEGGGATSAQPPQPPQSPKVVTPVEPSKPTPPNDVELKQQTLRLLGVWSGKVSQPNSSDQTTYTIEIEFYIGQNGLVFDSWYPELKCGGSGGLQSQSAKAATFYETITDGRETCVDGPFTVTYLKNKQLYWDWGKNQATATLGKQTEN